MINDIDIKDLIIVILKRIKNKIKCRYHNAYDLGLSINQLYEYEEKGQIRGKVSVDICDLFMQEIYHYGNDELQRMGLTLRIQKRNNDKSKDEKSFDICFIDGDDVIEYEIKFSQNEDAFQGSTHGKNKVDNFILINFHFDMNATIDDNLKSDIFGFVWIGITGFVDFIGEASTKTSRTGFKFHKNIYTQEQMNDLTKFGNVYPKVGSWQYWRLVGKKIED